MLTLYSHQHLIPALINFNNVAKAGRNRQYAIDNMQLSIPLIIARFAHCILSIAHCLLPIAHCSLPIAHCLLPIAYCLLPIAYCPLSIAYCPLPIAYCPLPIAYCPLSIAHCSIIPLLIIPSPSPLHPIPRAIGSSVLRPRPITLAVHIVSAAPYPSTFHPHIPRARVSRPHINRLHGTFPHHHLRGPAAH